MSEVPEVRICLAEDEWHGAVAINFHQNKWQVVKDHDSRLVAGDFVDGWTHMEADHSTTGVKTFDSEHDQSADNSGGGAGTLGATVEAVTFDDAEHLPTSDE